MSGQLGHGITELQMLSNLGRNAQSNRMLAEYYDLLRTRGQDVADMVYDVYERTGRWSTDVPTNIDKLTDVANSSKVKGGLSRTGQYLDEVAGPVQAGMQRMADQIPLGKGGATLSRMAGGRVAGLLAKGLPILGAVGAVGDVADIATNDTSFANKAMDTVGMGIGGTIGGIVSAGNPFVIAGGASLGKMGSDAIQYLFGGGKSAEQRKLEEALMLLEGRMV
jgi:hypothetical protein|tara:strand:+ start:792 stop:1457 length:666 start_codon:yes stop_codon:yes gene_type:complete